MSDMSEAKWTYCSRTYSQEDLDERDVDSFEDFNALPHNGECPIDDCDGRPMKSQSEVVCPECYTIISTTQIFESVEGSSEDSYPTLNVPKVGSPDGYRTVTGNTLRRIEYGRQLSNDHREHTDFLKQVGGYTTAYVAHDESDDDEPYTINNYDDEMGSIPL